VNLSYVAGFVDGEGCIGFAKCRSSIYPRVFVTNTNKEILEEFQDQFGGDINQLSMRKDGWKQGWSWRLSWSKAVDFLDAISPWLRIKADQVDTVFAWDAIRLGRGKTTELKRKEYEDCCSLLVERMHWLNSKGRSDGPDPIEKFTKK